MSEHQRVDDLFLLTYAIERGDISIDQAIKAGYSDYEVRQVRGFLTEKSIELSKRIKGRI